MTDKLLSAAKKLIIDGNLSGAHPSHHHLVAAVVAADRPWSRTWGVVFYGETSRCWYDIAVYRTRDNEEPAAMWRRIPAHSLSAAIAEMLREYGFNGELQINAFAGGESRMIDAHGRPTGPIVHCNFHENDTRSHAA